MMKKIQAAGVVNLTLWEPMAKHIWDYEEPMSDEDALRPPSVAYLR